MVGAAIATLDRGRVSVLRSTMAVPAFRDAFLSRAHRLGWLFALSFSMSLGVALFFPLWALLLGPMVYGIPHLFSSIRYSHREVSTSRPLLNGVMAIFGITAILRVFSDLGFLHWPWLASQTPWLEVFGTVAAIVAAGWVARRNWRLAVGSIALLLPLFGFLHFAPAATVGAMILIHNLVAFFFWYRSTQTQGERQTALGALFLFVAANVAIFGGWFDGFYQFFSPSAEISWASLNYGDLGQLIAPWSDDYRLWFHATVAYAFGQSLHYFIWMKAIPDQHHRHEVPTTFTESRRLLDGEMGRTVLPVVVLLSVGLLGVWLLGNYTTARALYFAVAGYHGYLELAGASLTVAATVGSQPAKKTG